MLLDLVVLGAAVLLIIVGARGSYTAVLSHFGVQTTTPGLAQEAPPGSPHG